MILAMTLAFNGLRTVIYPSTNLEVDKTWCSDSLGTQPYFDQPFYVGFNVAGYELALLPDADPSEGALVYWGSNPRHVKPSNWVSTSPSRWTQ